MDIKANKEKISTLTETLKNILNDEIIFFYRGLPNKAHAVDSLIKRYNDFVTEHQPFVDENNDYVASILNPVNLVKVSDVSNAIKAHENVFELYLEIQKYAYYLEACTHILENLRNSVQAPSSFVTSC